MSSEDDVEVRGGAKGPWDTRSHACRAMHGKCVVAWMKVGWRFCQSTTVEETGDARRDDDESDPASRERKEGRGGSQKASNSHLLMTPSASRSIFPKLSLSMFLASCSTKPAQSAYMSVGCFTVQTLPRGACARVLAMGGDPKGTVVATLDAYRFI